MTNIIPLVVLLSGALTGQGPPIIIQTLDGARVSGIWAACDEHCCIAVSIDSQLSQFPCDSILSVDLATPSDNSIKGTWPLTLWTRGGSLLPARLDNTGTQFETPFGSVGVDIGQLLALRWDQHERTLDEFEEMISQGSVTDQLLTLRDGKVSRFAGTLTSLKPDGGTFAYRDRTVTFQSDRVCGVLCASGAPPAPQVICQLTGPYRVAGTIDRAEANSVFLADSGNTLRVPLVAVDAITLRSTRVVYLSDLEPLEVVHRGLFDVDWPYRNDRAVSNEPLRMGGVTYGRGIGVHSYSALTFRVPAAAQSFAAIVGLDRAAGSRGEVLFRVEADGQELLRVGPLRRGDAPQSVATDVAGRRKVTLIVEPAGGLDIGDHANWANVRFIR
jgi:hypothetical protein